MSRRKGEFEHRTSIFEGAYRAWSHLGGCDPAKMLGDNAAEELDPLNYPHYNDVRLMRSSGSSTSTDVSMNPNNLKSGAAGVGGGVEDLNSSGNGNSNSKTSTAKIDYYYEPLPRAGLSHPFVQGIIAAWLGPTAGEDDLMTGLTTLRTWWQHRRRGESASARKQLGTARMVGVVQGYTRHFFKLALCFVVSDHEQPPRSLQGRLELQANEESMGMSTSMTGGMGGGMNMTDGDGTSMNADDAATVAGRKSNASSSVAAGMGMGKSMSLSPFENATPGSGGPGANGMGGVHVAGIGGWGEMRGGDCCGETVSVSTGTRSGTMSGRSRGGRRKGRPRARADRDRNRDSMGSGSMDVDAEGTEQHQAQLAPAPIYGDPTKVPVVFVSANGDIQIAMSITGITCTQCVKMIETVLRGVDGSPSPIEGLLDAVGDKDLSGTIIKISRASEAKRIAFQASTLLEMLGYKAVAREMDFVDNMNMDALKLAYDVVAATDQKDVFDWTMKCNCPDNGVIRADCVRHSQMNKRIFEAFDRREKQLKNHVVGCGRKNGLPCTCPPGTCKCKSGTCCVIKAEQLPPMSNTNMNPFGSGGGMTLSQNTFSQHITQAQAPNHQSQLGHFGSNFHQQHQRPQSQPQQPQYMTLAAPTNIISHAGANYVQPHLTQSHSILATMGQPAQAFNIQNTFPGATIQQQQIAQAQLSFQSQQQQQQQQQQQYLMQLQQQQQQQQQQLALLNLPTPIQHSSNEQCLNNLFHETHRKNGYDPPKSS